MSRKKLHPWLRFLAFKDSLTMRHAELLQRRTHRSFKRSYRRDYKRSLKLPGYWSFTASVWRMLWRNRRTFGLMVLFFVIMTIIIGGLISQDTYAKVNDAIKQSVGEVLSGSWVTLSQTAGVFFATMINPASLAADQQVYMVLLGLLVWLTTVWLLREIMVGRKPKMRDGLYRSGAPIVPTTIIMFVMLIQSIPILFVLLAYSALASFEFFTQGFGALLFWTAAVLITVMSLYWMVASFFAMVIVTLPGMYPMQALRAAGDLVVGRRLRILLRLVWLLLLTLLSWIIVVVPVMLLDSWLKGVWPAISWVPVVPIVIVFIGSLSLVWAATYIYLLYRKVVDDGASPA